MSETNEWQIKANYFGKALIAALDGVNPHDLVGMTGYTEDTCKLICEARDDAIKTLGNYLAPTSEPK